MPSVLAAGDLFPAAASTPAVQALRERVEKGESLSLDAVSPAAHPFVAALLGFLFPRHPIIVVTQNLKTQEVFPQDLQTWLAQLPSPSLRPSAVAEAMADKPSSPSLFFPSWEVLPHEARLPHVDVISDRLETLVALASKAVPQTRVVVASVAALLEKTLPPAELGRRTRRLQKGDQTGPLDLIEWLEAQGYEPEAQVGAKRRYFHARRHC